MHRVFSTSYVRSFLYTTGGFSHIYSSRPTCLSIQSPPYSLAAEIGFGSTMISLQVFMAEMAYSVEVVNRVFPLVLPPNLVHVLVVTEERTFHLCRHHRLPALHVL